MAQPPNLNITNATENPNLTGDAFALEVESAVAALASNHSGTGRPSYAVAGMIWHDTDDQVPKSYDGSSDREVLHRVAVPATSTSAGVVGQIAYDSSWLYICTAANVWRRVAIATW